MLPRLDRLTLSGYMKKVKEALAAKGKSEEDVTAFEKGASTKAKEIVANFKDYEFFIGESMDPDAMYVHSQCMVTKILISAGSCCSTTARTA